MNNSISVVARIVYGVPFAIFGLFHFMNGQAMAGMVPIPGGIFWIYLTGLALIAAAVSIITKKYARQASILLAVMIAIFALTIHLPGVFNPDTMAMSMSNFLKDIALAAAALYMARVFDKEEVLA